MLLDVQRVYVIQHSPSGQFLTEGLNFTKLLSRAGRLYDKEDAYETARTNLHGDEFAIFSFYEDVR